MGQYAVEPTLREVGVPVHPHEPIIWRGLGQGRGNVFPSLDAFLLSPLERNTNIRGVQLSVQGVQFVRSNCSVLSVIITIAYLTIRTSSFPDLPRFFSALSWICITVHDSNSIQGCFLIHSSIALFASGSQAKCFEERCLRDFLDLSSYFSILFSNVTSFLFCCSLEWKTNHFCRIPA